METKTYTPEQTMAMAAEGRFTKAELAELLAIEQRRPFLAACAHIESQPLKIFTRGLQVVDNDNEMIKGN